MDKEPAFQKHKEIFVTRTTFLKRTFNFRNFLYIITLGFAVLAVFSKQYDYFQFDLSVTLFIQRYNFFWFDSLMKLTSYTGNVESVVVLVGTLSSYGYLIGKRHAPLVLIGSTLGGFILSFILKIAVSRPRPDPELINQIGQYVWSDSFPSGHVLGAVSSYGFLFYIAHTQLKNGLLRSLVMAGCILAILLMGLSRMYLGAHWFSDVLGAYLIGFVWLAFITFIYHRLKPNVRPKD